MLKKNYASNRMDALSLGTLLVQGNLLAHVCDDHEFKADNLYFRSVASAPRRAVTRTPAFATRWSPDRTSTACYPPPPT